MSESNARDVERHTRTRRRRRKLRRLFYAVFLGVTLIGLTVGFILFAEYIHR